MRAWFIPLNNVIGRVLGDREPLFFIGLLLNLELRVFVFFCGVCYMISLFPASEMREVISRVFLKGHSLRFSFIFLSFFFR